MMGAMQDRKRARDPGRAQNDKRPVAVHDTEDRPAADLAQDEEPGCLRDAGRVVRAVRSHERGCDLDDEGCGEHGAEHASIEKGGPEDNDGLGPDQILDPGPQRTAARDRDPQRSAQQSGR
jgi:hypothetical protein